MLVEVRNSLDHIDKDNGGTTVVSGPSVLYRGSWQCVTSSAHWPSTLHNIIKPTDRNVRCSQKLNFNSKFVSVAMGISKKIATRLAGSGDRTWDPRMRVLRVITGSGRMSTLSTYLRRHYMQHAKVLTPRAATGHNYKILAIREVKKFPPYFVIF